MTSNKKNQLKLIVITGPTASGKTSLATQLAYDINSEIISASFFRSYFTNDESFNISLIKIGLYIFSELKVISYA